MTEQFSDIHQKNTTADHPITMNPANTATVPVPCLELDFYDWWARHEQVLELKDRIDPEIVLIGDSIIHMWGGEPKAEIVHGQAAWQSVFADYRVLNLGFGWDRVQNVLWRLQHGEMDGLRPKAVVIHIGTNNTSETANARANTPEEIKEGLQEICKQIAAIVPKTKIILMAVLPREHEADHPRRKQIAEINRLYADLAAAHHFTFVDIGARLLTADGTLLPEMAADYCHPTEKGYQIWADILRPLLPPVLST